MATRDIAPQANNEGGIGTTAKKWANVWATLINALTFTEQSVGFTISGGTTSKTLTVNDDATISGINTGDQDIPDTSEFTSLADTIALSIALGG